MQTQSPKRNTRSPKKLESKGSLAEKVVAHRFTESLLEQRENADLQLLCKEKDIELENYKNMLIGLNEKLEVFKDLQKDV